VVIAEYDPNFVPHRKTDEALRHSAEMLHIPLEVRWLSTADITVGRLQEADGLWIGPGSPYKSLEGALAAIRFAREQGVPLLATCGGFQHVIIEYARHVLRFQDAQHAEYDPYASRLVISRLACSLVGRTMHIALKPGSRVAALYGAEIACEQYYCNFGVNPTYIPLLSTGPLLIVGSDAEGEVRVVELPEHPFFIGTLYVPQLGVSKNRLHPLVNGFLKSATRARTAPVSDGRSG
jgi:CTP synthase (UTP-ammonia lyase)